MNFLSFAKTPVLALTLGVLMCQPSLTNAAVLTVDSYVFLGDATTDPGTDGVNLPLINLTSGTVDWIHWGGSTDTSFQRKSNGSGGAVGMISDYTGSGLTFPNNPVQFTWSDGVNESNQAISPPATSWYGTANAASSSNYNINNGVFTVTPVAGVSYQLDFYTGLANASSTNNLIVTLSGATTVTTPIITSTNSQENYLYRIYFTADNTSPLTVTSNGYVYMTAAALTVVPEPSSLLLLGIGGLFLFRRVARK